MFRHGRVLFPLHKIMLSSLKRALKGKNKTEHIAWSEEMSKSFETLKTKLTEKPTLYAPD